MQRSVEHVKKVIEEAKLEENELLPGYQAVFFASDIHEKNFLLLEMESEMLKQVMEKTNRLVFRGDKDEHAVLCTSEATYAVKEAETSNSLLLLPELDSGNVLDHGDRERAVVPRTVLGVFHTYLELVRCRPKVRKLKSLLEDNPYLGPEYEKDNLGAKHAFSDFLDRIQASETEILNTLRSMEAYHINGFWRLLDFDYHFRLLNHVLNLVAENSWSHSGVLRDRVLDTLQELEPREILEQFLDYFCDGSDNVLRLKDDRICRFFAEVVLRPAGKFNLKEFLEAWSLSVPEGMTTRLEQLDGFVLVDRNSRPEVIFRFPWDELPEDVQLRFNALFKTRPKWTLEEISPFLTDLLTDNTDANALLTKHARVCSQGASRYYTTKRPIT